MLHAALRSLPRSGQAPVDTHDGFMPLVRVPSTAMPIEPPFNPDEVVFGVECEFTDPIKANVGWGITARYRTAVARRCGDGFQPDFCTGFEMENCSIG